MDAQLVKIVGAYVIGLVIIGFGGYQMVTTGEIPPAWSNLINLVAGGLLLADAVHATIQRRNAKGG